MTPFVYQVLRKRIRHIRSVAPAGSEVFYEVGGKEPTPRPLGEDHGVVVFDYQPMGTGIMNYFRYDEATQNRCYLQMHHGFPL